MKIPNKKPEAIDNPKAGKVFTKSEANIHGTAMNNITVPGSIVADPNTLTNCLEPRSNPPKIEAASIRGLNIANQIKFWRAGLLAILFKRRETTN